MLKRRKRFILLACGVIAFGLAWALFPEREPSYNGHALSEWAEANSAFNDGHGFKFNPPRKDIQEALLAIGTNNLPYLVRCISYNSDTSITLKLVNIAKGRVMPERTAEFLFNRVRNKDILGDYSAATFKILGSLGSPAIQRLTKIMNSNHEASNSSIIRATPAGRAMRALAYIGEPAIQILITTAKDPKHPMRMLALEYLADKTNSPQAVAVLTQALKDPAMNVRDIATNALRPPANH